jgi:hypothetical protein
MHDFKALGIESEATRSLLYALASIRRGGYSAAHSHLVYLTELIGKGEVPEIGKDDAKMSKALSLALTDRYTESQAKQLGDTEHKDPKQRANPNPTRPTNSTGVMPTGEPQFTQVGEGGQPVPAYSPANWEAEAMEAMREQAGLSTDRTIRDLNAKREYAAHTRSAPPEAGDAPVERGPGQLPDPNAEDGGLGDEGAPQPAPVSEPPAPEPVPETPPAEEPEEDGEEQEPETAAAPKKRGRRAKTASS